MILNNIFLYTMLAAGSIYEPVEFSGISLIKYHWYLIKSFYAGYPWQMVTSYNITFACIAGVAIVFTMFWFRVYKEQQRKKKEQALEAYYTDKFRMVLGSADEYDAHEVLEILDKTEDELLAVDPYYFSLLLEKVRMEMYELVFLPNMQVLAYVLGVTRHCEKHLLEHDDVFKTLQLLLMLQITVNEGRLANYVNHSDPLIRMMARLNFIICSVNEPYRYLLEDLNEEQSLYRPMILNYVFGWMMYQDKHMPNFLNLAERVENEDSASYLIHEVAYWGKEQEKKDVRNLFLSPRLKVRSAAIQVVATLCDCDSEDKLMESYFMQPEHIRREVLQALLAINSGKQTEFFKLAYEQSASRETRQVALNCLYKYGNSGRRLFEIIRSEADEETRRLIDQIDSTALLTELQGL